MPASNLLVIWVSFLTSVALMGGVGAFVVQPDVQATAVAPLVALLAAALGSTLGSVVFWRRAVASRATGERLIGFALAESIVVLGLTARILGYPVPTVLAFTAWSLVVLAVQVPRTAERA